MSSLGNTDLAVLGFYVPRKTDIPPSQQKLMFKGAFKPEDDGTSLS
jgi:hypothetical protein